MDIALGRVAESNGEVAKVLSAIINVYRLVGWAGVVQRVLWRSYGATVRRFMPEVGPLFFGGIQGGSARRLGDKTVFAALRYDPIRAIPTYEQALLTALRGHVTATDRVVIVGTGQGVTVVQAALLATQGQVIGFEGDPEGHAATLRTVQTNGVGDRVTVNWTIVATGEHVYGLSRGAAVLAPNQLPECDVLELDCEGAEAPILDGLIIAPRVVVVETHGCFGASTRVVREKLERRGYHVQDLGYAEPDSELSCQAGDIRVLVGVRP